MPLRLQALNPSKMHNLHTSPRLRAPSSHVERGCTPTFSSADPAVVSAPPQPRKKSWVERTPKKVRPYLYLARVDKPIGILLFYYPFAWSITMASYALDLPIIILLTYLGLFGVCAFVTRALVCTIDDMWDRDIDKAVERTKMRPIAIGDVDIPQAAKFTGLQMAAWLAFLTQLNWYSTILGLWQFPLIVIYPLMKRITYWTSAACGLLLSWGVFLGWSAFAGSVNWTVCLPLYAGGVVWATVYTTIYEHQDKSDDVKIGVLSTALLFGEHTRLILSALSAICVGLIGTAGYMTDTLLTGVVGVPFYAGLGVGALQLARVLSQTDFDDRASCEKGFEACGWFGFWIWMGAVGNYFYLIL